MIKRKRMYQTDEQRRRRAWADRFEPGSIEELRYALEFSAWLVVNVGEWILPIFIRLEKELAHREEQEAALGRARRLVEKGQKRQAK